MNVNNFSIDQIKPLVRVKMLLDELFAISIRQLLARATGVEDSIPAITERQASEESMFQDYIEVRAQRLFNNDITVELTRREEVSAVVRKEAGQEAERQNQLATSPAEKEKEQFVADFSSDFQTKLVHTIADDPQLQVGLEQQYAEYWKWLNTISETATASGVTPENLPITLATYCTVAQQVMPKSEMMNTIQKIILAMFDPETWIQVSIAPALKMAAKMAPTPLTEEDLAELRGELEPEVRNYVNDIVPALRAKAFQAATAEIDMLWTDTSSVS